MSNSRDNDVDYLNRRGFLKLEAISRTVIWTVENYYSLLISEHSICSNTFRIPTLPKHLEVRCTVTVSDTENFSSLQKTEISHKFEDNYIPSISTSELKDHLQVILDGDEDNHVTIIVGEDAFQVHRTILCSHSSVFAAMFEHETSEKQEPNIYR
ncbi:speckle-type POZ protein [Caerostris extrusa]|uniref:Speckle-type POZ protein n=1 Tax=Caerostris extrusa TaxID=172846 RepID=A0AAV4V014_CAEEX|nr:speckle-type POZ protein [Caerostris extrusa]